VLNELQQTVYPTAQFIAAFECTAAGSIFDGTVYSYMLNVLQQTIYLME
jgi:hypothetical protein